MANGGGAPTIREVAGRADANIALISYYFSNSKGLVEATVAFVASRLRSKMSKEADTRDKHLFKIVENWIDIVAGDCGIRFFVYGPHFSDHPRVVAARSASENEIRNAAAEAISVNSHLSITPEDVVDVVVGPVLYNLLNWGEGITAEALRSRVFNHLQRMGLSRDKVPARPSTATEAPIPEMPVEKEVTENRVDKPKRPRKKREEPVPQPRRASLDFID